MHFGRARGSIFVGLFLFGGSGGALASCVGDEPANNGSDVDGSTTADGGGDGATSSGDGSTTGSDGGVVVAPGDFALSLSPSHVTMDTTDAFPVTITVARGANFTDSIDFTVTTATGLTTSSAASTGTGANTSGFTLTDVSAPKSDVTLTVTGTDANVTPHLVHNVTLGVHVGSALDVSDGGLSVPSYATGIVVKAWGAGGASTTSVDSTGGGSGYATATLPVTPGSFLVVKVGTGGTDVNEGFGAGGGGYTAICPTSGTCLLIAGGGGGAGAGGGNVGRGGAGGAGGGASGLPGGAGDSCTTNGGGGGTQSTGGATCGSAYDGTGGSSLQGGAGVGSQENAGGSPGGGNGGESAGGGGGGGYYGGGGGSWDGANVAAGGGGGSGYTSVDSGVLIAGNGTNPGMAADPSCPTGAGTGGTGGNPGGPGCIIVTLAKP